MGILPVGYNLPRPILVQRSLLGITPTTSGMRKNEYKEYDVLVLANGISTKTHYGYPYI